MAGGKKEIRNKIHSIKNTQKITRAMEMVAISKMRKTQDRMKRVRPFAEKVRAIIGHLVHANPDDVSTYMIEREVKRVGLVIVSTDRGLCGGLNMNLFRAVVTQIREWQAQNVEVDICTLGNKAGSFFRRIAGKGSKVQLVAHTAHLGDDPKAEKLGAPIKVLMDAYHEGKIDRVYLAYNHFVNTMSQVPQIQQLVPFVSSEDERVGRLWDYIYEPDPKTVLEELLKRYFDSMTYNSVLENIACEQAARMVAMKSASDNAGALIDEFQLAYNKARQAAITQELAEIVSGAAAV